MEDGVAVATIFYRLSNKAVKCDQLILRQTVHTFRLTAWSYKSAALGRHLDKNKGESRAYAYIYAKPDHPSANRTASLKDSPYVEFGGIQYFTVTAWCINSLNVRTFPGVVDGAPPYTHTTYTETLLDTLKWAALTQYMGRPGPANTTPNYNLTYFRTG
jgi:hypothetical protein